MDDLLQSGPRQYGFDMGDVSPAKPYEPDREKIRQELNNILETARAAKSTCPWDTRTFQYHKTVFPQMANWLPVEERDNLRIEFAKEVERIQHLTNA